MVYLNGLHGVIAVEGHVTNQPLQDAAACAGCDFLVRSKTVLSTIQSYCSLSRHEYMTCERSKYGPDGLEGAVKDRYQTR